MIDEEESSAVSTPSRTAVAVRSGLVSQRVKIFESPSAKARQLSMSYASGQRRSTTPVNAKENAEQSTNDYNKSDRSRSNYTASPTESRRSEATSPGPDQIPAQERQLHSETSPSPPPSPRAHTPRTPPPVSPKPQSYYRSSPSPRPRDSFAPTTELRDDDEAMAELRATPKASGGAQRRLTPSPRSSSTPPRPVTPSMTTTSSTYKATGHSLIERGVQHYGEGEYEKAHKAFSAELKARRANGPPETIEIALILGNLGSVYLQQNQFCQAEQVLLESLDLKRKLDPDMMVADLLNNLGNCMNLRGELEASLIYYEDALADIQRHPTSRRRTDEINAYFNIGRLEIQRKHWTKAMMALNEACRLAKETYSTNHVFVAQTLDLIGFVQLSTLQLDAAMVSFTGALAIYRRLYGPMHLEVANSLFNVGMVREAKQENADAWEAYTTARDLYARIGTHKDHPGYTAVRRSIAKVGPPSSSGSTMENSSSGRPAKKKGVTTRITVSAK